MPLILKDVEQSRGDLTIALSNEEGLPVSATSVLYSIKNELGAFVANNLPAIYQGNGKYYAPWNSSYPNGSYTVDWSVYINGSTKIFQEKIFILDKYAYPCSPGSPLGIPASSVPPDGSKTFLSGSTLDPDDLKILFTDAVNGLPKNPYSVFYSILKCNGCVLVARKAASYLKLGHFWVSDTLSGPTGNYAVKWEFTETSTSPLNTKIDYFSLICPRNIDIYECVC